MKVSRHRTSPILAAVASTVLFFTPASGSDLKVVMESRLGNLDPILSASHQTRDHGYRNNVKGVLEAPTNVLWNVSKDEQ